MAPHSPLSADGKNDASIRSMAKRAKRVSASQREVGPSMVFIQSPSPGSHSVPSRMRVLSWNVAGLISKLDNPDWGLFIDQHNVCLFQDTWARKNPQWLGYVSIRAVATFGGKGRPSGGLCTWVGSHLGCTAKQMESSSNYILCILTFSSRVRIALVNVY